jgi:hypothetical protein
MTIWGAIAAVFAALCFLMGFGFSIESKSAIHETVSGLTFVDGAIWALIATVAFATESIRKSLPYSRFIVKYTVKPKDGEPTSGEAEVMAMSDSHARRAFFISVPRETRYRTTIDRVSRAVRL